MVYLFVLHRLAGKCTKMYNACRTIVRLINPLFRDVFAAVVVCARSLLLWSIKSHDVALSVFCLLLYLWLKPTSHWNIPSVPWVPEVFFLVGGRSSPLASEKTSGIQGIHTGKRLWALSIRPKILVRKFPGKSSRKSGNCWISEKRTIQPKIPEISGWESNGKEISMKKNREFGYTSRGCPLFRNLCKVPTYYSARGQNFMLAHISIYG